VTCTGRANPRPEVTTIPRRPPGECPECGGEAFRPRFTTGGGWRVYAWVCESCGETVRGGEE
jgi:ribosomal protein L37AE/L43A